MKRTITFLLIYLFTLSFFPISVFAQETQTTTLFPSQDATIVQGNSSNYGSLSTLTCANDGVEFKSFSVKFDLGVLPSNAQIENVTLNLVQNNSGGDTVVVNVYRITSSWGETSVTGTNKPTIDTGVSYGALSVDTNNGQKTFPQDFSGLIKSWLANPSTNFGLHFEATTSANYSHEFGSRESGSKPSLVITYSIPDEDSPVISDIQVTEISSDEVTIKWVTSEESTSYVEYGEGTDYGKLSGSDDFVSSHIVKIGLLKSDATYHFKVISEDAVGNRIESEDRTFKTSKDGEEEGPEKSDEHVSSDIAPPQHLKLAIVTEDGKYSVELKWDHTITEDFDGYRIYRSGEDAISYVLLTEVGPDKTYYKDQEVEKGKTYFYILRTVRGEEESADSNEEVVTIYSSILGESLNGLSFWKGFIICNIFILPLFGLGYYYYKKKGKRLGKKKK
ncbi:fibronectin type III domain-containing protein [Candidatus Dojkabacteria bacterium]|nr:fibronectin type III domain-containing protein [Candidatus Dojkabacteria bacterium]